MLTLTPIFIKMSSVCYLSKIVPEVINAYTSSSIIGERRTVMNRKIVLGFFMSMLSLSSLVGIPFIVPVRATSISVIDLFTQKGGKGPNQPGGSFSSLELVFLYASVTYYNGSPVQAVLVAFEVLNPINKSVLNRAAQANSSGVATISFRIADLAYQPILVGTWIAIAKTKVCDEEIEDTLTFIVTYLVVGGKAIPIDVSLNNPEPQIPWIWLSMLILELAATTVFVKLKKKKQ
jgi:hypothetical protein